MTKKQKKNLIRICICLAAFAAAFIVDKIIDLGSVIGNEKWAWVLPVCVYLVVFLAIGYDVLFKAVRNIFGGQLLDENFLMCIASVGAFATGEYPEAVAVILFYQVGEWFQNYALGKSRKSIASLMNMRPDYANRLLDDGSAETVDPTEINVGDLIVVNPGERVPLDGVVITGTSALDTKALTGESAPYEVQEGSPVVSGSVNMTAKLVVRAEKAFHDSTVSKILELVENASEQKSRSENFITRFAHWYTPVVVGGAAILAIVPSLITGNWVEWIRRALNFLVVSCPCALVISVPLSFFSGIGAASRKGILVKGSAYLEKFNSANVFVFDKTGTLTKGNFAIVDVTPADSRDEILGLAAEAEQGSSHPIAVSITEEYGKPVLSHPQIENVAGKGVVATGERTVLCGNAKLMEAYGIDYDKPATIGTVVYVACDGKFVGSIVIADEVKPEAAEAIKNLKAIGAKTVMLTGDNEIIASSVAEKLGIDEVHASLLPQNKVEKLDDIIARKNSGDVVCFVGDGINDAPVLMRSDVGISMGGVGSDAAIEASDVVLMHDNLTAICDAKKIARRTIGVVYQNIIFALAVKAIILVLSVFGLASMWLAIFADVGVMILCILNAMRVNIEKKEKSAGTPTSVQKQ